MSDDEFDEFDLDAVELKKLGNDAFAKQSWGEAIAHYSSALAADPEEPHVIYSNRSAARLKAAAQDASDPFQLIEAAVLDAQQCVLRMPQWAKGHRRLSEALRAAGRFDEAVQCLREGSTAVGQDIATEGANEESKKLQSEANAGQKQWLEPRDRLDRGTPPGPREEAVVTDAAAASWRFDRACQCQKSGVAIDAVRKAGLLWRQGCAIAERGAKGTWYKALLCLLEAVTIDATVTGKLSPYRSLTLT